MTKTHFNGHLPGSKAVHFWTAKEVTLESGCGLFYYHTQAITKVAGPATCKNCKRKIGYRRL